MSEYYYECQEMALAPGIADGWPEVIPAPHTKNGRLVRRDGSYAKRIAGLEAEVERLAGLITKDAVRIEQEVDRAEQAERARDALLALAVTVKVHIKDQDVWWAVVNYPEKPEICLGDRVNEALGEKAKETDDE